MSGNDPAPTTGQQAPDGQPAMATPPTGEGANPSAGAAAQPEPTNAGVPQEQVDAIAARARDEGRTRLLKELGFDDPKELKDALAAFRAAEDAKLGENERMTKELEKRDKLLSDAAKANLDLVKELVLVDLGLTKEQRAEVAARLQGETREELEEDAQKLAKLLALPGAAEPPATPPANIGAPTGPAGGNTGKSLEEQIREAEAVGDFATSIELKGRLSAQVQTP